MLKNYIKIAWRTLLKNPLHASINIIGLAVALASFLIILIYFNYEMSYDQWDASLKRVYKISLRSNQDISPLTPAPLASLLSQTYPDAEAATAIMPAGDFEMLVSTGDKKIYQKGVIMVDSSFLKVFPYQLVAGNPSVALDRPDAVILSEEVSHKLFGNINPVGKALKIYNSIHAVVTGVIKKPAGPSSLDVQMIVRDPNGKSNMFWTNYSYHTYIKVRQPVPGKQLENEINRIYYNARLKKGNQSLEAYLKTGPQVALFADAMQDLHNFPKYGQSYFKITLVVLMLAVFLLIAGTINFSNLSVARAITRAREVGIRKVLGSKRIHIVIQFLLEIMIQCLISLLLAILMVNILLPSFSRSFGLQLSFFNHQNVVAISLQVAGSLLLIVLLSGLYPALFLSHYQPAQVLKGIYTKGIRGRLFRNSLLVVQLTLSALFIISIIIIKSQMHFMLNKDIGFNPSQVIRIEATQPSREEKFSFVKNTLLTVPGVEYVTKSTAVPGSKEMDTTTHEFRCAGKSFRLNSVKVSVDYFKTMGIQLSQGRLFEDDRLEDLDNTAIINQTALKKMDVANPVGRFIYFPYCDSIPYTIVGVVKDFNVQGFENAVKPAIYTTSNAHCMYQSGGAILVKINTRNVRQTLTGIETVWKKIEPDFPVRYSFLDQDFQHLFAEFVRFEKIIFFFTIISILISVTGLFALTSFLAQQRVKEIGIRKVLGASVNEVTTLLSKDFIRLGFIAISIAFPIAWMTLSKWLEGFAYKINLQWWMFAAGGLITISITLTAVSFHAVKAALASPVKSLRSE